jgi:hypothetical protein
MNIGGVVDSPSRRKRTITVVVVVIATAVLGVYAYLHYSAVRTVKVRGSRASRLAEPGWVDTIRGVAIYVLLDATAKFAPDLRTRFWEPQLKTLNLTTSVHYISDAKLDHISVPWIIPPYCAREGNDSDPGYCYRNVESWAHFVKRESKKRWYFKASQDTYINVGNLLRLIERLEAKVDPMAEPYFQYTIDEAEGCLTPDGITGWLISNAAVQVLFHHAPHFAFGCDKLGEDVGMAEMIQNLQLEVESFISPYFIAAWPNETVWALTAGAEKARFEDCPEKQYRYSEKVEAPFDDPRDLVATRMPFVPMDQVADLLAGFNQELRIGYPADHQPVFCFAREPPEEIPFPGGKP